MKNTIDIDELLLLEEVALELTLEKDDVDELLVVDYKIDFTIQ